MFDTVFPNTPSPRFVGRRDDDHRHGRKSARSAVLELARVIASCMDKLTGFSAPSSAIGDGRR
jgi:hypothetical protein